MERGKDDPLPLRLFGASKYPSFPVPLNPVGPTEPGVKIAGLVAPRRPATTAPLTLRCHTKEVNTHTRAAPNSTGPVPIT